MSTRAKGSLKRVRHTCSEAECEEPADVSCVGCERVSRYLCTTHARACVECAQAGPYCSECSNCVECRASKPADWRCWLCFRKLGVVVALCCVCKERRCSRCVVPCACGEGETHAVCTSRERHGCDWPFCENVVCEAGVFEQVIGSVLLCSEHRKAAHEKRAQLASGEKK